MGKFHKKSTLSEDTERRRYRAHSAHNITEKTRKPGNPVFVGERVKMWSYDELERQLGQPCVSVLSEKWLSDAEIEYLRLLDLQYISLERMSETSRNEHTPVLFNWSNEVQQCEDIIMFHLVLTCVQVFWQSCGGVEAVPLWHERSLAVAERHWTDPGGRDGTGRGAGPGSRSGTTTGQRSKVTHPFYNHTVVKDLLTSRL